MLGSFKIKAIVFAHRKPVMARIGCFMILDPLAVTAGYLSCDGITFNEVTLDFLARSFHVTPFG